MSSPQFLGHASDSGTHCCKRLEVPLRIVPSGQPITSPPKPSHHTAVKIRFGYVNVLTSTQYCFLQVQKADSRWGAACPLAANQVDLADARDAEESEPCKGFLRVQKTILCIGHGMAGNRHSPLKTMLGCRGSPHRFFACVTVRTSPCENLSNAHETSLHTAAPPRMPTCMHRGRKRYTV